MYHHYQHIFTDIFTTSTSTTSSSTVVTPTERITTTLRTTVTTTVHPLVVFVDERYRVTTASGVQELTPEEYHNLQDDRPDEP